MPHITSPSNVKSLAGKNGLDKTVQEDLRSEPRFPNPPAPLTEEQLGFLKEAGINRGELDRLVREAQPDFRKELIARRRAERGAQREKTSAEDPAPKPPVSSAFIPMIDAEEASKTLSFSPETMLSINEYHDPAAPPIRTTWSFLWEQTKDLHRLGLVPAATKEPSFGSVMERHPGQPGKLGIELLNRAGRNFGRVLSAILFPTDTAKTAANRSAEGLMYKAAKGHDIFPNVPPLSTRTEETLASAASLFSPANFIMFRAFGGAGTLAARSLVGETALGAAKGTAAQIAKGVIPRVAGGFTGGVGFGGTTEVLTQLAEEGVVTDVRQVVRSASTTGRDVALIGAAGSVFSEPVRALFRNKATSRFLSSLAGKLIDRGAIEAIGVPAEVATLAMLTAYESGRPITKQDMIDSTQFIMFLKGVQASEGLSFTRAAQLRYSGPKGREQLAILNSEGVTAIGRSRERLITGELHVEPKLSETVPEIIESLASGTRRGSIRHEGTSLDPLRITSEPKSLQEIMEIAVETQTPLKDVEMNAQWVDRGSSRELRFDSREEAVKHLYDLTIKEGLREGGHELTEADVRETVGFTGTLDPTGAEVAIDTPLGPRIDTRSPARKKADHILVDIWSYGASFERLGMVETARAVTGSAEMASNHQERFIRATREVGKLTGYDNDVAVAALMSLDDAAFFRDLPKDVQTKLLPAMKALEKAYAPYPALYMEEGGMASGGFKNRIGNELRGEIAKLLTELKGGFLKPGDKEFLAVQMKVAEDILKRVENDIGFVSLGLDAYAKDLALQDPLVLNRMLRLTSERKRKSLTLSDLVRDGIIDPSKINIASWLGAYGRHAGQDLATLRVIRNALNEGMVKHLKPGADPEPGWKKASSLNHNIDLLQEKQIHSMLAEWLNDATNAFDNPGWYETGMNFSKMSQFTNPLIMAKNNLLQASLDRVGTTLLGDPKTLARIPGQAWEAFKDIRENSPMLQQSQRDGSFSKPFKMPAKSYEAVLEEMTRYGGKFGTRMQIAMDSLAKGDLVEAGRLIYEPLWETAWKLDQWQRQITYREYVARGVPNPGEMTARMHGAYGSVPPKTRRFLTKTIPRFTPTFAIAMAKTGIGEMSNAMVRAMTGGMVDPRSQVFGLRKFTTAEQKAMFAATVGAAATAYMVNFMMRQGGWLPVADGDDFANSISGYARSYYQPDVIVTNPNTGKPEVLKVKIAIPQNVMFLQRQAQKILNSFGDPSQTNEFEAFLRQDLYAFNPGVRALTQTFLNTDNAGNPIWLNGDDTPTRWAKRANFLVSNFVGIMKWMHEGNSDPIAHEAMARQFNTVHRMMIDNMGFVRLGQMPKGAGAGALEKNPQLLMGQRIQRLSNDFSADVMTINRLSRFSQAQKMVQIKRLEETLKQDITAVQADPDYHKNIRYLARPDEGLLKRMVDALPHTPADKWIRDFLTVFQGGDPIVTNREQGLLVEEELLTPAGLTEPPKDPSSDVFVP